MSIPIIETPKELSKSLEIYRGIFTKPQFNHFQNLTKKKSTILEDGVYP